MSYLGLALAALGGTVASFAVGFLVMWLVPALFDEAHKYPAVFRPKEQMMKVMPLAMVATLLASLVVAVIFALTARSGSAALDGTRLGALVGVLAICNVMHNFVNLNIGSKLALGQAAAYFVQWTVGGVAIGVIYRVVSTP